MHKILLDIVSYEQKFWRKRKASLAAFGSLEEATDQPRGSRLHVYLFKSTVLTTPCCAKETSADISTMSRILYTIHGALERCLLELYRHSRRQAGLGSLDPRNLFHYQVRKESISIAKYWWESSNAYVNF